MGTKTSYEQLLEAEKNDMMIDLVEISTGRNCTASSYPNNQVKVYIGAGDGSDDIIINADEFNDKFGVVRIYKDSETVDIKERYFSANNIEESDRLKLYDSNGDYMDYVDMSIADDDFIYLLESAANLIDGHTLMFLYDYFDVAGFINTTMSGTSIEEIKEQYGDEYVNVIGNIAVIMQEA